MKSFRKLLPIYSAGFFFSLHYALILYLNSSLLSKYFSVGYISLLYILTSVLGLTLFFLVPRVIGIFSPRGILVIFLTLEYLAVSGLIIGSSPLTIALSFILHGGVSLLVYYLIDIFLEDLTDNKLTGTIRGTFLTLVNTAIALAPLVLASFIVGDELQIVYFASLSILIPVLMLVIAGFKSNVNVAHLDNFSLPLIDWWQNQSLRRVTIARSVLEFFYTFMIIYTPIYLHTHIGFSWTQIGIIFSIMLLPFVIFEWPVGVLADKEFGEKEFMSTGFLVTALSLIIMPFLGASVFLWTSILFLSRVGASFIEVTTESYFFKHVEAKNSRLISIFRLARPVAVGLAAGLGIFINAFFNFETIFLFLAAVVFFGLRQSFLLRDTQ